MATMDITKDNFEATVSKEGIVLLDFWAEWCGPCRTYGPIFEASSEKHTDITFGKVNADTEGEIAGAFDVRGIPTTLFYRDGIPVHIQTGLLSEQNLDELIGQIKALDMDAVRKQWEEQQSQS